MLTDRLEIRTTEQRGRGVFARVPIAAGEIVERCPVVVLPHSQVEALATTELGAYFFQWGGTRDQAAIALGYGSLYNHTNEPNAIYVRKESESVLEFVALREIAPGEEITVSYHGGFGDRSPVDFELR